MLAIALGTVIFIICILFAYVFSSIFGDIHHVYLFAILLTGFMYMILGGLAALDNEGTDKYYDLGIGIPGIIVGCALAATFHCTGTFVTNANLAYLGIYPMLILAGIMSAGYFIGNAYLMRYLYRTKTATISEYFNKRFCSEKLGQIGFLVNVIPMMMYIVSLTLALGGLMGYVTGLNYTVCSAILLFGTLTSVLISGNRGLAIIEMIMAMVMLVGTVVGITLFVQGVGNGSWSGAFAKLLNSQYHDFVTWKGGPALYGSVCKNYFWGIYAALIFMSISMAAPWQIRCYVISKNEREMTKASLIAAVLVFVIWFFGMTDAVMLRGTPVHVISRMTTVMVDYPGKFMPVWAGMLILAAVITAGISSIAIFLMMISECFAKNILIKREFNDEQRVHIGRLFMVAVAAMVWLFIVNVKITMLSALISAIELMAASVVPVIFASVWSKKLTKQGAMYGCISAFIVVAILHVYYITNDIYPHLWLMPGYVGAAVNVLVMRFVSKRTQVTEEEKAFREAMFVMPEEEKTPEAMRSNLFWARLSILAGPLAALFLIWLWAWPVFKAAH